MEAGDMEGWEGDGVADGVNEPTKENLSSHPAAITLLELLDGDGFLVPGAVGRIQWPEDYVDG